MRRLSNVFPCTLAGVLACMLGGLAYAQAPPRQQTNTGGIGPDIERAELQQALQEAANSAEDTIRVLETHLRKYPKSTVLPEVQQLLAKESIEVGDKRRIALYGVPTLERTPNDVQLLDRVPMALLNVGGKENAERALDLAKRYEDYVIRIPVPKGSDPVRNQEDHDRALERALLYQSRALSILGNHDESRRKAALAYIAYPEEPSAREWAEALDRAGEHQAAIERMADAFTIPDRRVTDSDRLQDRRQLGEMYKRLHDGSETGLGEEILKSYDRTVAAVEKRHRELLPLDPNNGVTEPGKFVLDGVEGNKLPLVSLRGKVLVMDFWATWCIPCRAQHPLYEQVRKRFEDRNDVVFLSVNADETHDPVPGFLDTFNWSKAVYFDSGLSRLMQVANIPTTIILDKDGRLASRMNGFLPDRFVDQLSARIESILAGPVIMPVNGPLQQ
ncbi:MAG: TlpA disulfide reductase family protein [Bryobacteraceae bacterium]